MVGAMTLKLAENASLEEMVRFGVAAGSAATLNQGTRLCSHDDTQKIYAYLSANKNIPPALGGITTNLSATRFSDYAQKVM